MAANLDQLDPSFKTMMKECYAECDLQGFVLRPGTTGRTPWTQARLWRQSRATEEIQVGIAHLNVNGANFLANILHDVGPQHGPWATNALPGLSWHNWRPARACDSFLVDNGKAIWVDGPGYRSLRQAATKRGLTNMARLHDYGHIQLPKLEVPMTYGLRELDQMMLDIWGETEIVI